MNLSVRDLRIGNLVKCKVSNDAAIYTIIAIDGINLKAMLSGVRKGQWYSDDWDDKGKIKPILLNEEWLLKFGFETDQITWWKECTINTIPAKFHIAHFANDRFSWLPTNQIHIQGLHLNHVHQLQNLFFALTGNELTFK